MDIYNCTNYKFGLLNGRLKFPSHSATFIVKACFDLQNNNTVSLSEEQLECNGDQFYPEDKEKIGSLTYSSDFVYYKPNADISLVGHCYVPEGRAATACPVGFQMNENVTEMVVFGDRYWEHKLTGATISDPKAFEKMPLRYENSFGGIDYPKNPVGKGANSIKGESGETIWPLPNIETKTSYITSPNQTPDPVGFGPLNSEWSFRKQKLGTYDDKWLENKWPWFPDNFDSSYFNAAPPLLQLEGELKGDEILQFTHLHADVSHYKTQLPRLTVRCFTRTISTDPSNAKSFQEMRMKLDTLHVDMDAEQLVLVWRGWTPVVSEEMEDISDILIIAESLNDEPASVDDCYALLKTCQAEQERDYEEAPAEVERVESAEQLDPAETPELTALIAKAEADSRAALVDAGIDPDNLPEPSEEEKQLIEKILADVDLAVKDEPVKSLEDLAGIIASDDSLSSADLSQLDVASIDFSGIDLRGADFSERDLNNARFAGANLGGALFCGANLTAAKLRGALLAEADFTGALLADADCRGAVLEQTIFEACDAQAANFDGINAPGVDFSRSKLQGASFRQASLPSASFEHSNLNHVAMHNAMLGNARFDGASAMAAVFTGANLSGMRASDNNDFSFADFTGAQLEGAILTGATCVKTNFSYADMHDVNLIEANLTEADMRCADLRQAKLTKACLNNTNMSQVNLFEASLEKATLHGTKLQGANLYGAELLDVDIESVDLSHVNLKMTKLDGVK